MILSKVLEIYLTAPTQRHPARYQLELEHCQPLLLPEFVASASPPESQLDTISAVVTLHVSVIQTLGLALLHPHLLRIQPGRSLCCCKFEAGEFLSALGIYSKSFLLSIQPFSW